MLSPFPLVVEMPGTPQSAERAPVRLTLFADLRRFAPKGHTGPLEFVLDDGATVADLIAAAGVREPTLTVSVNGALGTKESILKPGDEVTFFSQMEGG